MAPLDRPYCFIAVLCSLLLILSFSCSAQNRTSVPAKGEKYESAWKTIDSLTSNGLTQSALNAIDTIYKKAKAAANADQMIKTIVYRMRFESYKEEDAFVKALGRLNEELKTAVFPVAPLLHSMLAECYWHYYQDNRWRFADRTQTTKFELKDIRTWDLKTIMEAMTAEYELSLKDGDALKKTRLDLYDEVIDNRDSDGGLRPTLFDFLAHRAVDFFSGDEGDFTRPAFEFTLNSADYFKPFDEFSRLTITTQDSGSLKFHSLVLLQKLVAFHASDKDPAALIDADLKRLSFVRQHAVVPGKDSLYLKALEKLEIRFPGSPSSAEVTYQIALLYREWAGTWQHRIAELYRWMNKAALELCGKAERSFKDSYGAAQCTNLAGQIREKSMNFTIEYVNVPDKPFKAMLQYKNISHVYWRQVAIRLEDYQKLVTRFYDSDSLVMALAKLKPIKQWNVALPDPGDCQEHSVELDVPAIPVGHYLILAASDPDFRRAKQAVCYGTTQVSNLSYIDRTEHGGGHEFYMLDRMSGTSLKGVSARAWVQVYDQWARNYKKVLQGTFTSDAEGHLSIPPQRENRNNCTVEFLIGKDRLYLNDQYYLYRYGKPQKEMNIVTYFFTDRAIYRPGQTIFFKGIMLTTDGEKNDIVPGTSTTVRFYNVNQQEVAHLDLTTNAYGSIHGSFIAPTGSLNGQMYIAGTNGQAYFSVEDYKRPKFEVTTNPFKGTKRLGETVRLEGTAKAYAGSAIDGAKVKYRIVRQARFPNWWWCWWRPAAWSSEMEIANGTTVTNDTGGFFVDFTAQPDPSIPKTENPVFSYTGYFDVTDMTGETRSTVGSVSVGYVSLTLCIDVPQQVNKETAGPFTVSTANLNGTFEPAKISVVVYKLKTPPKVYRTRSWALPDTQAMTRTRHDELFPQDLYDDELNIAAWAKGDKVFETAFDADKDKNLSVKKIADWPQGAYVLEGRTKDPAGNEVKDIRYFTLYSAKEKNVPYPLADWYVPIKEQCEPGEKASFLIGSGYENVQVLYEIEHKNEIVAREWIKLSKEQKRIEIPIEEKHRGNLGYHLTFIHGNRSYQHTGTITVPWTNKELDISFETFRDKLTPGEKEEWRLKIAGKNKDKIAAEMVASLYDASLDAFRTHNWYFGIWPSFGPNQQWSITRCFEAVNAETHTDDWNDYPGLPSRSYPYLNWFGYSFEGSEYGYGGYAPVSRMMKSKAAEMEMDEMSAPKRSAPAPMELAGNLKEEKVAQLSAGGYSEKSGRVQGSGGSQKPIAGEPRPPKEDLSKVSARTNLNETAFFYPQLATNEDGEIIIKFQIPEALTKWKMLGFAHTRDLKYGQITKELITQKDLMVMPNLPRFFRENDKITLTAKVSNMADKELSGTAQLMLFDAATAKPIDAEFKNSAAQVSFTAKKGQSAPLAWDLSVPEGVGAVSVRVVAKSGAFSDGEEQIVPVLSNRMLVTEAMPLPIRKKETKKFTFSKLVSQNNNSTTLRNYKLTLEFTSNPAWYAVQALPYMMEYPYECAEQTFARYYANSIASSIANSSPRIKQVFDTWRTVQPEALLSNLEKNQELKSLVLEETPWLLDGKDESERKKRVALLFDLNKMGNEKERALTRLKKLQLGNGGWPWFEGMPDDRYITQYIAIGMGRLDHLGMIALRKDGTLWDMIQRCLRYLDDRTREDYEEILENIKRYGGSLDSNHLSEIQIQYLYTRSYFKDVEIAQNNKKAFDYFLGQSKRYWLRNRRYMQGMIALELTRNNDKEVPPKIMRSLKENSLMSEEMGMYWKEMYADAGNGYWWWYDAPIESQALMVEAFDEVSHDTVSVEDLKAWLLKSKQTQNWETTRATAEACYALLLRGTKWLDRQSTVSITLGEVTIDAAKPGTASPEAGTGYFKTSWSGSDIKPAMGNITISKGEAGVAWGAVYWQYFEQLDKITLHETPLKLTKQLFLEQNSPTGPKISPIMSGTPLKPGDKIKVRIELRVDRDMEYVHMKDMRASGFEPLNVFSGYRWQDGLGYYESTRDAATNFFFGSLHKGTFVFEYPLTVTHAGDFSNGITTIQCMYAPEFTSQSEGVRVKVDKK